MRYGVQLYGKVRLQDQDPINSDLKDIQTAQNRMMRTMVGKNLSDHVSTSDLLRMTNMLSVNQLNAQIKLVEIWKASNMDNNPLKLNKKQIVPENINTRACTQGKLIVPGTKLIIQKTCITDAMKIWNTCPLSITSASTLPSAKSEIKKFVKSLPD